MEARSWYVEEVHRGQKRRSTKHRRRAFPFDWPQPSSPGAVATDLRFDIVRSPDPGDFVGAATCEASSIDRNGPFNDAYLLASPASGGLFSYLVPALDACGAGPPGYASTGSQTSARDGVAALDFALRIPPPQGER